MSVPGSETIAPTDVDPKSFSGSSTQFKLGVDPHW
jgi:hypothetical protein